MTFEEFWKESREEFSEKAQILGLFALKQLCKKSWDKALENQWHPIETAPKDGTRLDLWCKLWRSHNDTWMYQRFTDCYWNDYKYIDNARAQWENMSDGWHPTHWMPLPQPPKENRCHPHPIK